jgi:murein DD-endopeptidase MepM/ murein hydrolase activator NlpD
MKRAVLVAVMVAVQFVVPPPGSAQQVDPCEPIPIPELCDEEPLPNPTESPPPEPVPGDGNDGSKEDTQKDSKKKDQKKKGRHDKQRRRSPRFFMAGPKNTLRLMSILSVLPRYGMPLAVAVRKVVGPFPVAGLAWWTDDWHACRDGCRRLHQGLDIFARHGTPLVAVTDGTVTRKGMGGLAGISVEIQDARGVQYFYAHLSRWADGLREGMQVRRGQVVGYVGNTGNAITTPPHVHFEYQPGGGPRPPKPHVDRWLRMAERRAVELVERVTGKPFSKIAETVSDFRLTRLFDLAGELGSGDLASEQMFLMAGLQPAVPSLQVARRTIGLMAWEIDWGDRAEARLNALAQEYSRFLAEQQLSSGWSAGFGASAGSTGSAGGFD